MNTFVCLERGSAVRAYVRLARSSLRLWRPALLLTETEVSPQEKGAGLRPPSCANPRSPQGYREPSMALLTECLPSLPPPKGLSRPSPVHTSTHTRGCTSARPYLPSNHAPAWTPALSQEGRKAPPVWTLELKLGPTVPDGGAQDGQPCPRDRGDKTSCSGAAPKSPVWCPPPRPEHRHGSHIGKGACGPRCWRAATPNSTGCPGPAHTCSGEELGPVGSQAAALQLLPAPWVSPARTLLVSGLHGRSWSKARGTDPPQRSSASTLLQLALEVFLFLIPGPSNTSPFASQFPECSAARSQRRWEPCARCAWRQLRPTRSAAL